MADTPQGETVTPVAPSNEPGNTPAPATVNSSADVEQAKREAEQARIRANQLENEKKALEDKLAAQERQKLEEKEEFKSLYEQTNAKLNEVLESQASAERQKELSTATDEVFKDYSPQAVELAKVAGLSLSENSDEARASLKEKLDVFQKQVGSSAPTPTPNNPRQTSPEAVSREELVKRNEDGVSPMALAGAKGNDSVIRNYIREIPAIQRMKEIAQNGA
jgi:hypothetical protein